MASAAPDYKTGPADLKKAERLARELAGVYTVPPIPVLEIAERCGVRVIAATFGDLQENVSGVSDFSARQIHLNVEDPPERQAYAAAHELGHFLLHAEIFMANPDLYTLLPRVGAPKGSPLEDEAHAFAAELLIPKQLLMPVAKSAPPTQLASIFKVPIDLIERRLKKL
jgi:Zn-dependent peptidase ImmA (M78 family)